MPGRLRCIYSFLLLCPFVFAACFNPLKNQNETVVTMHWGTAGRAVCFPGDSFTENDIDYTVTLTNIATNGVVQAAVAKSPGSISAQAVITPGTWLFHVEARLLSSMPVNVLYALASEVHNIRQSQTVVIKMKRSVTVHFESNGGSTVATPQYVPDDGLVTRPGNPSLSGYSFDGWYKDDITFQNPWNFSSDRVSYTSSPYTLYAKWVLLPRWKTITAGSYHNMAIKTDGSLWVWGANDLGQLGNGTTTHSRVPIPVTAGETWSAVTGGLNHTAAIKTDGSLWDWGYYDSGTAGIPVTPNLVPVQKLSGITPETWAAVSAGDNHTVAIKTDGSLWAWGLNDRGQLGDGTTVNRSSPVVINSSETWTAVSAGYEHSLAITNDGRLFTWGTNAYGQLGDATNTDRTIPVQIGPMAVGVTWDSAAAGFQHSMAITSDGRLFAWGYNFYGQLGDGSSGYGSDENAPVRIAPAETWIAVSAGNNHTAAIKADGSMWTWGNNMNGELGDGTNGSSSGKITPVPIAAGVTWTAVSAGDYHTIAMKSDGSLWAWGRNDGGRLGDGTQTDRNIPVQISGP